MALNSVLFRLTRRHIGRRLFQSVLFVIGVALGVAIGVAIDLANDSAQRAFGLSVDSVTGQTTHQIVGSTSGLPSQLYQDIRTELGIRDSAPIVQALVRVPTLDDRTLRLLGVDPFAEAPFRDYLIPDNLDAETLAGYYAFLVKPNTVLISEPLAARFDIQPRDLLTLQTRTRANVEVEVAGLLYPTDELSREALDNLLIADIATAQELTGKPGSISRIDLILPDDYDLSKITAILPPGAALVEPENRNDALSQMTAAFELNLQALSLLALLVGVFLIYNTVTFSVVQRRPVIGILRSLGTTRRQIFVLVLAEALMLGLIGTLLGLGLGYVLGQGTVKLVAQTINDLYFRVNVEQVTVQPVTLLKGMIIGLLVSVLSAVIPSYEATRTPPVGVLRRSSVERGTRRLIPFITSAAVLCNVAGLVLLQLPDTDIIFSFVALFLILVGCAMLTPLALIAILRVVAPVSARFFGVLGRMAARAVLRSLSRTSVAVAALTLAVSVIVGVGVMISSFRSTVTDWLDVTLGADIFISPFSGSDPSIGADIDPAIMADLQALDGVERVTAVRSVDVFAPDFPDLPRVNLVAPNADITSRPRRFAWNTAPGGDYWAALLAGDVIVSEPFAYRRGITREENTITLLTDRGEHTFTVVGVYYDYTTDQGTVMMHHSIYRQHYDDPFWSALALHLLPGTDLQSVLDTLQTDTLVGTGLQAQSNRDLRQNVLDIFNRTFSITVALRLLAMIVAFIGILSALLSLQLEHTWQYGVMRANGLTPRQLRTFTFIQTGLMGIVAGLLALPVGLVLALILIFVINVRSFGWTMELALRPQEFVQAFAVALLAALAAGIYPAWRLSRLVTVRALRSE